MAEKLIPIQVPVEQENQLLSVISLQEQPDGRLYAQLHHVDLEQASRHSVIEAANLLRLLADLMEIEALGE